MQTGRRLPRPREVKALLRPRPPAAGRSARGLSRAVSVEDLRELARRRVPAAVFDYVDGGAGDEVSMRRARAAFERVEFSPLVLRDVSSVNLGTTILGRPAAMPVVLAPTGFTRMMHHRGERAVAPVAVAEHIPYALSTLGTTSIEELAAVAPDADRWFQLYVWRDRARSKELIARAAAAGYTCLVVTVDVPVQGNRLRDARNGLTMPPALTARTVAGMLRRPRWWLDALTTEPLSFATFAEGSPASLEEIITHMFDPGVTFDDFEWLRSSWGGSLVVKGVGSVEDARELARLGADGLVLSNHGGRQLDRAPTPLELLPQVAAEVGDRIAVMVDGGVRSGADVAAAVALGAAACLVGRVYLYGLMAGGQAGVARAVELLRLDLQRTMQLLGVRELSELAGRARLR
jgi:L-lactate dehydrogenase (cytochrome)